MFETAELGRSVSRKDYKKQVPLLRQQLLAIQQQLRNQDFPVIIVFAGVDGAGKGDTVNLLNEWMDPRWLITRAYAAPTDEESQRPEYWRYWRDLPPRGRIGLFLSSWYSAPLLDRVMGGIDMAELESRLDRIVNFERALADDGALILKFWMHLGKSAQKKRLKTLQDDPELSWRVSESDWDHWHQYEAFIGAAEHIVMRTSSDRTLWHLVEGADAHYRSLTVGGIIRDAIGKHMQRIRIRQELSASPAYSTLSPPDMGEVTPASEDEASPAPHPLDRQPTILQTLDMDRQLGKSSYNKQLVAAQARLNKLHRAALQKAVSTVLVFEGWDAAGKGGAIRRCTAALDARHYQVLPFAAPTDEERQHHYLWRFWRHLGRAGRVTFFDRSWYGRVLVERVENLITEPVVMRAYGEIADFEEQLVEHGIVLLKFWLHITAEEQLRRFKSREETPWKRWKLTDEDWRNRERWPDYEQAVNDMVARTSTRAAPWTLVEANDKHYARIKVLTTLCDSLEKSL